MPFFTADYLSFFEELAHNNKKEWFDVHRDRYINEVREPFKDFAHAVASKLREFDELIDPSPYIYRINNDLRFQPDKPPYKLHKSASFSPVSDAKALAGYYIQLSAENIFLGGGMYDVDTKTKHRVRDYLAAHLDDFKQLWEEPAFVNYYEQIEGKKNKRLPKHLREAAKEEPLLFNTQWVYSTTIPAELILSDKILDELMKRYQAIYPLNNFFRKAMLS